MPGWSENSSAFVYVFLMPFRLIAFGMSLFLGLGGISIDCWIGRFLVFGAWVSLLPKLYELATGAFGANQIIAGALVLAILLGFIDLFRYLNKTTKH